MKLWNDELQSKTPELYETETTPITDKIITAKFFALGSAFTWYVMEAQELACGDVLFFGFIDNGNPYESELGYFTLRELESLRFGPIPRVERDLHFDPKPFRELEAGKRFIERSIA